MGTVQQLLPTGYFDETFHEELDKTLIFPHAEELEGVQKCLRKYIQQQHPDGHKFYKKQLHNNMLLVQQYRKTLSSLQKNMTSTY